MRALRRIAAALAGSALLAAPAAAQSPEAPFDIATPGTPGLAVGFTEPNPAFLWPASAGELPEPFAGWRDAVAAMRPQVVRIVLDWPSLQPQPDAPGDLAVPQTGCARGTPPCLGWLGVREQLQALAARQRLAPTDAVAVITGTPAWAASEPSGCERPADGPRSRAPRDDALPAYRQLVLDVLAAAREAGAELRWWSPWNEPNHPYFLSPQRAECDVASPTLAIPPYVRLARALGAALDEAPGEQEVVLGDLAGSIGGSRNVTSIAEFVAAMPDDVLCAARVWAVHAYVSTRDPAGASAAALDARGCPRPHAIWITETGLGRARAGAPSDDPVPQEEPGACARLRDWLDRFYADPRVTVALQYTLREDPTFRTGLITAALDRAYPTLAAWQAWGARESPADPAPDACPA